MPHRTARAAGVGLVCLAASAFSRADEPVFLICKNTSYIRTIGKTQPQRGTTTTERPILRIDGQTLDKWDPVLKKWETRCHDHQSRQYETMHSQCTVKDGIASYTVSARGYSTTAKLSIAEGRFSSIVHFAGSSSIERVTTGTCKTTSDPSLPH